MRATAPRYGFRRRRTGTACFSSRRIMWMRAEAEQLESENYRIAAENLRNAAEVSDLAADNMRKMGEHAI